MQNTYGITSVCASTDAFTFFITVFTDINSQTVRSNSNM